MDGKKKKARKYFTAEEIKMMVHKKQQMPSTTCLKNEKKSFIAKVRGTIYGETGGKHELR